jgi:hypothetical protein
MPLIVGPRRKFIETDDDAIEQKAFCFPVNSRPSEAGESKPEQQPANRLGAPDGIPEFPEPDFEGSVVRDRNRVLQCSRDSCPRSRIADAQ